MMKKIIQLIENEKNKLQECHFLSWLSNSEIPVDEKITNYRNALTGNLESNLLSDTFFSSGNILILQHSIMAGVYKASNGRFQIGYQNVDTLKIIMRSIFLQHSANLSNNITLFISTNLPINPDITG